MAAPVAAAAAKAALKEEATRRGIEQAKRPRTIVLALALLFMLLALALGGVFGLAAIVTDVDRSTVPQGVEIAGIPTRAATAYQAYGTHCPGLDWTLLAAVGAVESNHGQNGLSTIDDGTGEARPWIFGPALNGAGGTAAIGIGSWAGWWGLTGPWMQAVGPMQFLPPTFEAHAIDGNRDGDTNPHQIDDAVATTASYLCAASGENVDGVEEIARIYNPGSSTYADELRAAQQDILDALPQATPMAGGNGTATVCPIAGPVDFTDTWGAPRSGGRSHEGVDMFAAHGTPVVAPEAGTVEHYDNSLGGLSYRLYGDSGTYYYGTHLSAYENVGAGHVAAGTVIGYVGQTGNAAGTPPHLHWEIHPSGRGNPVNPTPTAFSLCGS